MRRALAQIAVAVAVAGCAGAPVLPTPTAPPSPAATPSPAPTARPTPTPAMTPAPTSGPTPTSAPVSSPSVAGGWPVTVAAAPDGTVTVGADGTTYAWNDGSDGGSELVALDAGGRLRPGWPFVLPAGRTGGEVVVAPDGSVLVAVRGDGVPGYELHRLDAVGSELPGWPYRDPLAVVCQPPVVDESATYLACQPDERANLRLVALDRRGEVLRGWPVTLKETTVGGPWWVEDLLIGTDGTVYLLAGSNSAPGAFLWGVSPEGRVAAGWPWTLPDGPSRALVVPGGRILVATYVLPAKPNEGLCGEADHTVLVELDGEGGTVPGWPQSAPGWADPAVAADGAVYYLVRDRLFSRTAGGAMRRGWPVAVPDVYPECNRYGPYLAPDGTAYVLADGLRPFDRDGRPKPGWPFRSAADIAPPVCVTDVPPATQPAIAPDGTVFVAVRSAAVGGPDDRIDLVALDPRSRVLPGWPYRLPAEPVAGIALHHVAGRLHASLAGCDGTTTILVLQRDGTLAR